MSIEELEAYFKTFELPPKVKLHKAIVIEDVPLFIEGHLSVLKQYGLNNPTFKSFYDQLIRLKDILSEAS
ncbi:DUF6965 family protein [Mucilaginibacter sp. SP1R1]|uniref:DUF6965 family protein n=1 Tax=Mucilaginibacter sp. SP1R1 TaxID=2723091 RepID=UPI00160EA8FB|nr:hypothetical protein [Mucilaginibacter sp. SP1R1]MBB6149502.1 hypothetical protein [Mucilaginibacter sp. SP1R1]